MSEPKVWLLRDGERYPVTVPTDTISQALVHGVMCPGCRATPLAVLGSGTYASEDDRALEARGYCAACRAHVGVIRAEVDTVFGVREDRAVLNGRCRVY